MSPRPSERLFILYWFDLFNCDNVLCQFIELFQCGTVTRYKAVHKENNSGFYCYVGLKSLKYTQIKQWSSF